MPAAAARAPCTRPPSSISPTASMAERSSTRPAPWRCSQADPPTPGSRSAPCRSSSISPTPPNATPHSDPRVSLGKSARDIADHGKATAAGARIILSRPWTYMWDVGQGIGSRVQSLSARGGRAAASTAVMPFQIRGRSFTAVVLELAGAADQAFYEALDALLQQAPHFFTNAPFVIDLDKAASLQLNGDFTRLVRELRGRKLSVIGVINGSMGQNAAARDGGRVAAASAIAEPAPATLLISEPVRSGQRIFADRGDLVVVSSVSSGAELIAQGSIHIYGRLRGRALAGVNGDRTARIFCQSRVAELVAIAGLYRTSDDLGPAVRQQRVQAFLQDERLCLESLK